MEDDPLTDDDDNTQMDFESDSEDFKVLLPNTKDENQIEFVIPCQSSKEESIPSESKTDDEKLQGKFLFELTIGLTSLVFGILNINLVPILCPITLIAIVIRIAI